MARLDEEILNYIRRNGPSTPIDIAQKLGVWPEPLKLYSHLSKSGGGLVFRIPSDIEKQLKLNEKTEITITKVGKKIIIEPEN